MARQDVSVAWKGCDMTSPDQKSSIYMDFLREIHRDIALRTGISLEKETVKALRVLKTRGIVSLIEWFERKLESFVISGVRPASVEYSSLMAAAGDWSTCRPDVTLEQAEAYASLRLLYFVFRKLTAVPCSESDDSAYEKFKERQLSMVAPLSPSQWMLADEISKELSELIPDVDLNALVPDVGPGASAEKRRRQDRVEYSYLRVLRFNGSSHEDPGPVSRACAVPKTYKRRRLIFIEPSSRMLVQKALQAWLYAQASRYPLKGHVSFDDQGFQRQALAFSDAATIDLSDASDYIDRRVMWLCLRRHPTIRAIAFSSRSSYTDRGDMIRCFSTMGNALTFPLMTLLLVCVCRICESNPRVRVWRSRVFGDDIVCSNVIAGSVRCVLTDLGLKVNASKSYTGKPFLESCGRDIFGRFDVTPVKIKDLSVVSASDWSRVLDYANGLFVAGYWRSSDVLVSELLARWPKTAVVRISENTGLKSFVAHSDEGVWRKDWQAYVPWKPKGIEDSCESHDSLAMLDYFLAHGKRVTDSALSSKNDGADRAIM